MSYRAHGSRRVRAVGSLPLTQNGKLDRGAFARANAENTLRMKSLLLPGHDEERLAVMLSPCLDWSRLASPTTFHVGGHSLLGPTYLSHSRKVWVEMALRTLLMRDNRATIARDRRW